MFPFFRRKRDRVTARVSNQPYSQTVLIDTSPDWHHVGKLFELLNHHGIGQVCTLETGVGHFYVHVLHNRTIAERFAEMGVRS